MATSFLVSCQKEDNLDIVQIDDFESIDVLNDNTTSLRTLTLSRI